MNELKPIIDNIMLPHIGKDIPQAQYEERLYSICGHFEMRLSKGRNTVWGCTALQVCAGLEVAVIASDYLQAARTVNSIAQDQSQHYYLIMQLEGRALMTQPPVSKMLLPGDMILIDSSKPSEFNFFGEQQSQFSLHLSHDKMHQNFGKDLTAGLTLSRDEPIAMAIRSILVQACQSEAGNLQNSFLHDALFNLLGAALVEKRRYQASHAYSIMESDSPLLAKALAIIENGASSPDFSVSTLSDTLGVSLRQVQRAFQPLGVTPTRFLLTKRLENTRNQLLTMPGILKNQLISNIAYNSGFSDLSYFNKKFKEAFGASPKAYRSKQIETE